MKTNQLAIASKADVMAYSATLGDSQQLTIANLGAQTQINLMMSSSGQQQSQSSSFSTGKWSSEPKLFGMGQGFVLQINTDRDSHYILIQQNNISTIQSPDGLNNYPQIDLREISQPNSEPSFPSMQPLKPMQPLKMGNMSMDINSMSMQMGNMSLGSTKRQKNNTTKQFCSQCGTEAKTGDRFCRSCGHELDR